jgi:RNA polymerase sigma-70 factor (ECF subfamily)
MSDWPLCEAFLQVSENSTLSELPPEQRRALERRLHSAHQAARAQCDNEAEKRKLAAPKPVSAERFAVHLARCLARRSEVALEDLITSDIYLALACGLEDPAAVALCTAIHDDEISRGLARMGLRDAQVDEIKQALNEKLYVSEKQDPYIFQYSGHGRLGAWQRVIATRMALKRMRSNREDPTPDEKLLQGMQSGLSASNPEQQLMKLFYRDEFKQAFRQAAAELSDQQRKLLWLHHVDGRTIDELGEMLGVHRSTAARQIERARRALVSAIRRMMMTRLEMGRATCDSVLRLVRTNLDVSVRQLITPSAKNS